MAWLEPEKGGKQPKVKKLLILTKFMDGFVKAAFEKG